MKRGTIPLFHNKAEIEAAERETYDRLAEENVTVIRLDDMSEWQDAMKPVYDSHVGNHLGLIERIRDI